MKTKEELNTLKEEAGTGSEQYRLLTVEELEQVIGGVEGYKEEEIDLSNTVIENDNYIPHKSLFS